MITCGIWPTTRNRLVAVVITDAGLKRAPILTARTMAAATALIEYLVSEVNADIILAELLLGEPIGRAAIRSGRLWIAPRALVEPMRQAAALQATTTAAMLARLPRVPALRRELRRHTIDPRQLTLL